MRIVSGMRGTRRSWRACALAAVFCVVAGIAPAMAQSPWALVDVIQPPVPEGEMRIGFGTQVSLDVPGWLIVGAHAADCVDGAGNVIQDAGSVFLYKRVGGQWQHRQTYCSRVPQPSAYYGMALAAWGKWAIVGEPFHDAASPNGHPIGAAGRVEFLRYDAGADLWRRDVGFAGSTVSGLLGHSVAVKNGVAVAGEPFANDHVGQIRTWRVGETAAYEGTHGPSELISYAYYGRSVALTGTGCVLPACTHRADAIVVNGDFDSYVSLRTAGDWTATERLVPPAGTRFVRGDNAITADRLMLRVWVEATTALVPCAANEWATVVFRRDAGHRYTFGAAVCRPPWALSTFGNAFAIGSDGEFLVSSVDAAWMTPTPSPPGTVTTYTSTPAIAPVDVLYGLELAPVVPGDPQSSYDDAFGTSLSLVRSRLAVGAPWQGNGFQSAGRGYVAIYER